MKISLGFVLLASIAFVPLDSANAGFQFTAPIERPSIELTPNLPNIAPQMPAVPAVQVQQAPVPVIATPKQTPQPPSVISSPQPVFIQPTPAPVIEPPSTSSTSDLAVGFGKDLPLATALKQVIPDGYTYVIDPDVNIGNNVSWSGGKPWPAVLGDMVSPAGLKTEVDGKIVRITKPQRATQPVVQNLVPSAPTQIASAANYTRPKTMVDALPSFTPSAPVESIKPHNPVIETPWEAEETQTTPTSILSPQLREETMIISSTEPRAIAGLEKSIVPEVTRGQWIAQSGGSLKTVLESWSNLESVDLFWSADYDYTLAGDVNISGNFEEAVEELLKGFSDAKPKPTGRLHPNLPHGPAVLVIEATQTNN